MICGMHLVRGTKFPRYGGILAVSAFILREGGEFESILKLIQPKDNYSYTPQQLRESRLTFEDLNKNGVRDDEAYEAIASWLSERKTSYAVCLDFTQVEWLAEWGIRHAQYFGGLPKVISVDSIEATMRLCGVSPEPFVPRCDLADSKAMAQELAMWLSGLLGRYSVTDQTPQLPEKKEVALGRV